MAARDFLADLLPGQRRCNCGRVWGSDAAFAGHTRWKPSCRLSPADVLAQYVHYTDDCWIWTGTSWPSGRTGNDYGQLSHNGRKWKAHRWAFVTIGGHPIPKGYELDHLCRQTLCVNPAHLEAVPPDVHEERTRARKLIDAESDMNPDPW